jgi:hypothetical protein
MGRPVGKRFFGTTVGGASLAGGEGVASIAITTQGNNYSQGATLLFASSPIGGTTATGTATVWDPASASNLSYKFGTGSVTSAGTGYLTAPAITVVKPANVAVTASAFSGNLAGNILTVSDTTGIYLGMHTTGVGLSIHSHVKAVWSGNGNVLMSSGVTPTFSAGTVTFYDRGSGAVLTATLNPAVTTGNTIQANAWTTTGSLGKTADIVSQRGSRRYRVTNADGTSVCRLVANAAVVAAGGPLSAGEMTITATESTGATYFVAKLDSRTATIWRGTGTQFANLAQVPWSMNTAVANVSVKISTNN